MKGYRKLRWWILDQLKDLNPNLSYHGFHHTMDVLKVCNNYIRRLKLSKREAYLLRIAALAHDVGFTKSNQEHEKIGAEMMAEKMSSLGFSQRDIDDIVAMIIATKPLNPANTKLEKIICDADLDYLGRDDYKKISDSLYKEFQYLNIVKDQKDWLKLQIKFLASHKYQTEFAKRNRRHKKMLWLEKIRQELSQYK